MPSMVDRFPALNESLEEHVADNFGDALPHVFFGDVTPYVESLHLAASRGGVLQRRELRAILDHLERAFGSDPEIQELIAVSFLENLPRPGEVGSEIRRLVGPSLAAQLRRIG